MGSLKSNLQIFDLISRNRIKMAKSVDWAKLGWCMTQAVKVGADSTSMFANGKARYGAFKAASDAILGQHTAAVNRAASIDFDHYKKALPAQSAWIGDMEKQYALLCRPSRRPRTRSATVSLLTTLSLRKLLRVLLPLLIALPARHRPSSTSLAVCHHRCR